MVEPATRELSDRLDWICPRHGVHVKLAVRTRTDERTGKKKFAGEYYRCPNYSDCGYYVSLETKRVPLVGRDGRRLTLDKDG